MGTLRVARTEALASVPPTNTLLVSRVLGLSAGSNVLHIAQIEGVSDAPSADDQRLQVARVFIEAVGIPVVNAGVAQTVRAFAQVTLSGTVTGPTTEVEWVQQHGTPVALSSMTPTASFTAPATAAGETLVFQLQASNAAGEAIPSSVAVSVIPHTEWYLNTDGTWHPFRFERI